MSAQYWRWSKPADAGAKPYHPSCVDLQVRPLSSHSIYGPTTFPAILLQQSCFHNLSHSFHSLDALESDIPSNTHRMSAPCSSSTFLIVVPPLSAMAGCLLGLMIPETIGRVHPFGGELDHCWNMVLHRSRVAKTARRGTCAVESFTLHPHYGTGPSVV